MMNDLDNLKDAWKSISEPGAVSAYSADELRRMVRKRSNNELSKIRRKIILEWSVAFLLSLFLVLFVRVINPADTKFALLFIGLILAVSFIPYVKVIRLKLANHPDLKSYLTIFIDRFDRLIKQYIRMAAFLIPIAGLGGFLLGFHSAAQEEWPVFFENLNLILLLLFVALISFCGYWLQKRYFRWIYGKNIQRLRQCLDDLNEVE
ncbi:MAG: hypothetical protein AB7S69_01790 [Salinivirgaceae bacterium]